MMGDEDVKIPTSINIYVRQKKWLMDNEFNISDFVRKAIDEKIADMTGYTLEIERTKERIKQLENELGENKENLTWLEKKQSQFEHEVDMENKNDLIWRAISNIDYSDWREAAEDLKEIRGSLSTEEWEGMVRRRWEEIHGERRNPK